jgi:hypothetical protein
MKKRKPKPEQTEELEIDSEDIEKDIEEETKSGHYIDNKVFYAEMVKWKAFVDLERAAGRKTPPVTDYIGQCFLDIATHLSYRPNFINYPYREEMIGDGIENCLMYASNFDPSKSKNPFSYFTQIIYFAFLRRIAREKKQMYIRYRMLEAADKTGVIRRNLLDVTESTTDDPVAEFFHLSQTDIAKFSKTEQAKDNRKNKAKKTKGNKRNRLDEV